MTKYDQLHIFIDETGDFGKDDDILLVGGVVLLGEYDENVQTALRDAVCESLKVICGRYPQNIHANKIWKSRNNPSGFFADLVKGLNKWRKDTGITAYGTFIRHESDIHSESSKIIDENYFDNRYFAMLRTLLEQVIFANRTVSRRLTDNASVHLHIANRKISVSKNDVKTIKTAELLGWRVKPDQYDPNKVCFWTVNEDGIRTWFQIMIETRWKGAEKVLYSVQCPSINYMKNPNFKEESTPALYLADLLLGLERQRISPRFHVPQNIPAPLLPIPDAMKLTYDRQITFITECQRLLDENQLDWLFKLLENQPIDPKKPETSGILMHLTRIFSESPDRFHSLYEEAWKKSEAPNSRSLGLKLHDMLEYIRDHSSKQDDPGSILYSTLIQLTLYNHTGDVEKADDLWNGTYLELEAKYLPGIFEMKKGMALRNIFRCSRAVNLMDQFRLVEAGLVLWEQGKSEREHLKYLKQLCGESAQYLDQRQLGICNSSCAQVLAFLAKDHPEKAKLARKLFRDAYPCFTEKGDQERIQVYLGHLACDFPDEFKGTWNTMNKKLSPLVADPDQWKEYPFVLAVIVKGILVFGTDEEKRAWADKLNQFFADFPETQLKFHPYGLILQIIAMLHGDIYLQTRQKDDLKKMDFYYDKAEKSLFKGEKLLQFLASVTGIRRFLFHAKLDMNNTRKSKTLKVRLGNFDTKAISYFKNIPNPFCVDHPENITPIDHATEILKRIRFNYW